MLMVMYRADIIQIPVPFEEGCEREIKERQSVRGEGEDIESDNRDGECKKNIDYHEEKESRWESQGKISIKQEREIEKIIKVTQTHTHTHTKGRK